MDQVIQLLQDRLDITKESLARKEQDFEQRFMPFYNGIQDEKVLMEKQLDGCRKEVSELERAIEQLGGTE